MNEDMHGLIEQTEVYRQIRQREMLAQSFLARQMQYVSHTLQAEAKSAINEGLSQTKESASEYIDKAKGLAAKGAKSATEQANNVLSSGKD